MTQNYFPVKKITMVGFSIIKRMFILDVCLYRSDTAVLESVDRTNIKVRNKPTVFTQLIVNYSVGI